MCVKYPSRGKYHNYAVIFTLHQYNNVEVNDGSEKNSN